MLRTIRGYVLLLLCLCFAQSLDATHIMGGEITWACQGNGTYVFTLKIYRDCQGNPLQFPIALRVHNHPTVSAIPLTLVSQTDISPVCNGSGPTFSCDNPTQDGAVEEFVLRSNPVNLPGTPPVQGWIFTYDDCCRNQAIDNVVVNPSETGITLRAIMYAYPGNTASPCFDSSPVFAQLPAIIICAENPFTYNHNAFDPDKDSLSYEFGYPLDWLNGAAFAGSTPDTLNYYANSPYSALNPFGVPTSLNRSTGEIAFTPNLTGNFVTVVKVSAYRCGFLVAEIYRELQVVIIACGANNPPVITAPFISPVTGLQTSFTDTVMAGDLVSFSIIGTDNEFLPIGVAQSLRVTASGGQFGAGFTSTTTGCNNPPCATLSPAPPVILPNNGSVSFNWQTTCDHVAINEDCFATQNTHTFVLSFQDDFCPAPSYNIATVSIVVTAPPVTSSPSLRCLEVLPSGDVQLTWIPPPDPENQFNSYHIFAGPGPNGPFTVVDSIFNLAQNTYTHLGANADAGSVYYFIRSRSGCGGIVFSPALDTLQTIYLLVDDGGAGNINLNWNGLSNPLPSTSQLPYRIDKDVSPDPPAFWQNTPGLSANDFMVGCTQDIFYQVSIPDASGCVSRSNRNGGPFSNDEPPDTPFLDSVSVNPFNNQVLLGWQSSPSPDVESYILYAVNGSDTTAIDTVPLTELQAVLSGLLPQNGSLSFAVSALDECDEESEVSPVHSSIFLEYELLGCLGKVDLRWNSYSAYPQSDLSYEVWLSVNNGPYVLSGTATAGGNMLSYSSSNLLPNQQYCFFVRARSLSSGFSSTSNLICFEADVQNLPDFSYLRRATVIDNSTAYTRCLIDTASDIAFYRVVRAIWPLGQRDTLDFLPLPSGTNELEFWDAGVNTAENSYEYVFVLIDKCNLPSGVSNPGRTILLSGVAGDGFVNRLKWNTYGEWEAGVKEYTLFRSIDFGGSFIPWFTSESDTLFNDNVINTLDTTLDICYRVRAIELPGNSFNVRDTSWSNVLCLQQKATVYIPNAFIPQGAGQNTSFKAQGLYERLALNHRFTVFNRWGEEIFSTSDPKKAWDGKYNSAYVPSGVYVYHLAFDLPDGSRVNKRGAVTVIE